MPAMTLDRYAAKRRFESTPEPAPGDPAPRFGALTFVVQKHAARGLHYDFRLEFGGALKSWAVPRGPSFDPKEKRLAVLVEDHPIEYSSFEGVIGRGNYGAGQVIVWDTGVYTPDERGDLSWHDRIEAERRMAAGFEQGKLSFTLRGRKLRGSWTLVRTARSPKDWLLIKHKDSYVSADPDMDECSVVSGLSLEDLKSGVLPNPSLALSDGTIGKPGRFPRTLTPMLASTGDRPFSSPDWIYEAKLDGFRAMAFLHEGTVRLLSRNGNDLARNFPAITAELSTLPHRELVLDGEVVALNEEGLPDFGLLQNHSGMPRMWRADRSDEPVLLVYYPFDVIYLEGRDLRRVPLEQRKQLLAQAVVPGDRIRTVDYVTGEGEAFFEAAAGLGLEGMVAKRRSSSYQAGQRSRDWVKVKHVLSQEFVVAGYTEGEGERASSFGAIVVGYYQVPVARLIWGWGNLTCRYGNPLAA